MCFIGGYGPWQKTPNSHQSPLLLLPVPPPPQWCFACAAQLHIPSVCFRMFRPSPNPPAMICRRMVLKIGRFEHMKNGRHEMCQTKTPDLENLTILNSKNVLKIWYFTLSNRIVDFWMLVETLLKLARCSNRGVASNLTYISMLLSVSRQHTILPP